MVGGRRAIVGRRLGTSSRKAGLVAAALLAVGLVTLAGQLPAWSLIDNRAFDYLSTYSPPPKPVDGPVIVAIDEPSFAELGLQWPWPRGVHGRVIERLREAGARAIALDIIFAEPTSEEEDAKLAAALGPDVVLAGDETLISTPQADEFVRTTPLARFTDRGALTGIASIALGRDGVMRELPALDDGFAARAAMVAGLPIEPPEAGKLLQSFGGPRTYETVSYYQALDPDRMLPPGIFRDRVVLIGLSLQNAPDVAAGGTDVFATSYTVHTGQLLAGVELQATVLDNLRAGVAITPASRWTAFVAVCIAAALAATLAWRGTGWRTAPATALGLLTILIATYLTLRFGRIFISPVGPSLAVMAVAIIQSTLDYAAESRIRRQITTAFGQYLSPELVRRLAEDPGQLKLGGEKRVLTVLFCDVRDFTTIAESLKDDPEQLTHLVNRLLTPLSDVILAHGGTIDKYIGDSIMAFWNAPLDNPDHAFAGVSAALDMLDAMDVLNDELRHEAEAGGHAFVPLRIGIGLNTGECIVGNMGSNRRFDYSALGDTVNLAARLEGASKQFGLSLLMGEETARAVAERYPVFQLDSITVKGRSSETIVSTVIRQAPPAVLLRHKQFIEAIDAGRLEEAALVAGELAEALPALEAYYRQRRPDRRSAADVRMRPRF